MRDGSEASSPLGLQPPCRASSRRNAILVILLASVWLVVLISSVPADLESIDTWTTVFEEQRSRPETVVAQMDGQAFAQHAVDPTMERLVDGYRGDVDQAAYRAMRPVQGWLAWGLSGGGHRAAVAPALLVIGVASLGAVALLVGRLAETEGLWHRSTLLLLAMPAVVAQLRWPGLCEPLAAAAVLGGMWRWRRGDAVGGVVLFCVAALTRETTLLIPLGLAVHLLLTRRKLGPALPLAVPAVLYLLWGFAVRLRLGVTPSGSAQSGLPLAGLVDAVPHWRPAEVLTAVTLVLAGAAVWRTGRPELRAILLVHIAFVSLLGTVVWWYWWGFGRVLLPLYVLALLGRPALPDGARGAA